MDYEIERFIKERNIKSLYHFTGVDNLELILKYGLLSRDILEEEDMDYYVNDEVRYDNRLDTICTSISFPNYKMFYKVRNDCSDDLQWCVIEIDAKILAEKQCVFCKENASSKNETSRNTYEKIGINGLRALFDNSELRREIGLPDYYTTNPQAEVLVEDEIPISYIKSIYFKGFIPTDIKRRYNSTFNLHINDDLFKYRFDYDYWR